MADDSTRKTTRPTSLAQIFGVKIDASDEMDNRRQPAVDGFIRRTGRQK